MSRFYFFSILFILTSYCTLASELTVPASIKVLKVNGKNYSGSFFESEEKVALKSGRNVLILQYKELFEDYDNDDHTTITSSPFVALFNVNIDDELLLRHVKIIDEKQAREFAENPAIELITNNNAHIDVYSEGLEQYQNQLSFEKLSKNIHRSETRSIDQQDSTVLANESTISQVENETNVNVLAMLEYWWKQASDEQKAHFIQNLTQKN